MAHLSLSFLGSFQVTLDGQPVTDFKSNKVRALLAYLAVEADQPHRREALAGLLWPDWPDREALSHLRYALSDLRRAIGDRAGSENSEPRFLLVSRSSLQFNRASDFWLDMATLEESAQTDRSDPAAVNRMQGAVDLYRGSFLQGFSLGDSPAFEEWARFTAERLGRLMSSLLHDLAAVHEHRGEYEQAQTYAWRQLELEPWDETAHQQVMRALALSGERSAALAHYETCRRVLADELDVEPSRETTKLYEQIREDSLGAVAPLPRSPIPLGPQIRQPSFLKGEAVHVERGVFVAREAELAQLNRYLAQALTGQGQVALVTGEAGSGKTSLIHEFSRCAQEAHADLLVASGNCNAYTGIGDPYLPFREILELLTGDVEARWAAGAMTRDHALRLWDVLPLACQALIETGPHLIDTFLPRRPLLDRATACAKCEADWLARLRTHVERRREAAAKTRPQQSDLFEQYTRVLRALGQSRPLLLLADDLQWADVSSISLLFHLGRHLAGARILFVGAYRPEDVAIGRDGDRHPLQPLVNEFQRGFGSIIVALGKSEGQAFTDALLDSEPNRLTTDFRRMLHRQTGGHPLFTTELLQGLQERGDLVLDKEGRWVEGPMLDWEALPARVEAVIAERLERLAQPLQAMLQVASVEGEVFTAEVVARVRQADERELVGRLSGDLDRRHRLVRAESIDRLGSQRLSRYRFRNYLFQKYLYDGLDRVERTYLHEDVGNVLEGLYGDQAGEYAVQLAWHFQEAGIAEKAIQYLHQAGDRAVRLSAYRDGRTHLTQALSMLTSLPESPERLRKELDLQLSLAMAWKARIPDPEGEAVLRRARELCEEAGLVTELSRVLGELSVYPYVRADYQASRELGEQTLKLARQLEDPLLVALAQWHLGYVLFGLGEFAASRAHLHDLLSFYDPKRHHQPFLAVRGSDAGASAMAYEACCLWCLGYPEQALRRSEEALALARELDHGFTLADVLCFGGALFHSLRRDAEALMTVAVEFTRLSGSLDFSSFWGTGTCYLGEALTKLGEVEAGQSNIREGMEVRQAVGARCYLSGILGALAEAQMLAGEPEEGLNTLDEAFAFVHRTDERFCEAELLRLQGEFLMQQGDEEEAEVSLQRAISVASGQNAKAWELRATTTLAKLWQKQGKTQDAQEALASIYGWFTEGHDTPDLRAARVLLDELT